MNPITALEFYRTFTPKFFINYKQELLVLVGEGSSLKVFSAETSASQTCSVLWQCEILKGQAIHGIAVQDHQNDESCIVIWGGHEFVVLQSRDFEDLLGSATTSIAETSATASDWILDVAVSTDDQNGLAIVTAHNTILQAKIDKNSGAVSLTDLSSPSRSILYSAHLIWESSSCLLVAAGTVFGEIIVWRCAVLDKNEVLHVFTGHEGSIFGVHISAPIHFLDNSIGRLLASCSDDRTIRVWSLSAESVHDGPDSYSSLLRETGYGNNNVGGQVEDYKCLTTAMAHASRIWRVRFLPLQGEGCNIELLSFGEDSTAQHWAIDFSISGTKSRGFPNGLRREVTPQASLRHLNTLAFHSGKHIWSTAVHPSTHGNSTIVTGGADGKVTLYDLQPVKSHLPPEPENEILGTVRETSGSCRLLCSEWDVKDVTTACPFNVVAAGLPVVKQSLDESLTSLQKAANQKEKKGPKDSFNRYAFCGPDKVLATTTLGKVFRGHINESIEWQEITLPNGDFDALKSYAVVVGYSDMVFLAGSKGAIYFYKEHDEDHRDLIRFSEVNHKVADMFVLFGSEEHRIELLVTTLGGRTATLMTLDVSEAEGAKMSSSTQFELPEKFIVTSAFRSHGLLFLGSRAGSIALFGSDTLEFICCLWTPSLTPPTDAITSILAISPPTATVALPNISSDIFYILVTSRDGTYAIFECIKTPQCALRLVHKGTPPFGPMVEHAWITEQDQLILYGFKGKNFVVWNETTQVLVSSIECGGAHRSYAYSPISTVSGYGHFIYTKASRMCIQSQHDASHRILNRGGHGREIKACAASPSYEIMATGAEDTEIRLWSYEDNSLVCKQVIQKHTTGIQALKFHGESYLFSSGGNEEFFVWALTPIPSFGLGVVCEASLPDTSEDHDLRIMSFDISDHPVEPDALLISLAYSDSTFKSYQYSKGDSFRLIAKGRYTSSCLTQIRHLVVNMDKVVILTTSTDGRLVTWSIGSDCTFTRLSSHKFHQSSIKCLDVAARDDRITIATGGDDGAIAISVYSSLDINRPQVFIQRSAHGAAVTGLTFLPYKDADDRSLALVTSSNDQRVKEWEIQLSGDNHVDTYVRIEKRGDGSTAIADVGDLAVLSDGRNGGSRVLVVGNGMEVWRQD